MAVPTLDGTAQHVDLPPFRGACPRCWEEVLVVEVAGADVVVEVMEVLETFRCPVCAQVAAKNHERGRCLRCMDSGFIGEPLPPFAIAITPEGAARYFVGGRPRHGDALHREHSCRLA